MSKKMETSKLIVITLLAISILDLQISYILCLLDKEPMETLAVAIVTEIVAVTLGYFIKAFNAKKESEKNRLKREINGLPESENEDERYSI